MFQQLLRGFLLLALVYPCSAQQYSAYLNQDTGTSASDSLWYTVRGERHGPSFFKRHQHPEVEYEATDTLTFDTYHTAQVMYTWLERWAEAYPNLVDLYEVGKSFEGRPILQVTLTNKETGKDLDKPAAFFEGGRHSGEITSSESVLWLIQHLPHAIWSGCRDYQVVGHQSDLPPAPEQSRWLGNVPALGTTQPQYRPAAR